MLVTYQIYGEPNRLQPPTPAYTDALFPLGRATAASRAATKQRNYVLGIPFSRLVACGVSDTTVQVRHVAASANVRVEHCVWLLTRACSLLSVASFFFFTDGDVKARKAFGFSTSSVAAIRLRPCNLFMTQCDAVQAPSPPFLAVSVSPREKAATF